MVVPRRDWKITLPSRKSSVLDQLPDLPVRACVPELRERLAAGHVVLTAETGSGKTTLIPLLLRDEPWLAGKRIIVLEPRRPAARMAAYRMSALLNEAVGATVGYQVRFEQRVSADTRVEVITEGLFLRRLQADPELSGIGLVVFDEFHERNQQADLSLAFTLDVARGLREDLRVLIMSASLDPAPLCALLPASPVHAGGRAFPVSVHHDRRDAELNQAVPACARLAGQALGETSGDLLVFLPGRREIQQFIEVSATQLTDEPLDVLPLFGDLDSAAQDRVLRPPLRRPRRVIAATDIAETSLTIEGISAVVDSGLARRPSFDPATGLTRLKTVRISRASAQQRAGRAGRLGPGRCYRAWTEARHARLEEAVVPELQQADLAPAVLEVAAWGSDIEALAWLNKPPAGAWAAGLELLEALGAVTAKGVVTARGRRMAKFPTHPRLAHLLDAASNAEQQRLAVDIAAILSERDPIRRGSAVVAGVDLAARLDLLVRFREHQKLPSTADLAALRQIDKVAQQLIRLCGKKTSSTRILTPRSVGTALLLAYPDRVAHASPGDGRRFLLRSGRAVVLPEGDPLSGSTWLVVASVDAGRREGRIDLAASVDQAAVRDICQAQLVSERVVHWDDAVKDIVARSISRLDAIVLSDAAVPLEADDPVLERLRQRACEVGIEQLFVLPDDLIARVGLMRRLEPDEGWPDFSSRGLTETLLDWLGPWVPARAGLRQIRKLDLGKVLRQYLGYALVRRLDDQLPSWFETAAGTRRRIQYSADADPVLALPLQEMFGLAVGPSLASGRVALVLHLLSPAGRPLQITRDLAAFWAGAYSDVRKEMRGRYPKHHWPEHPAAEVATRSLKRRRPRS